MMIKSDSSKTITYSDPFNPVFLWKEALLVVVLIAFQRLGQPASFITALLLIVLSFRSAKGAVQALALVTLFSYLNSTYFPGGFNSAAKWIVLIAASCAGIMHCYRSAKEGVKLETRWLVPLLMFVAIAGISSSVSGIDPEMALFKLFTFTVGALGAMYVFGTKDINLPYIVSWFYTVWVVILFISIPLIRFGNGYLASTRMFMGILNHSQAFAVFMVPISLYFVIRWLVGMRLSIWQKVITVLGCYLVYLSSSRTGVFSFMLALIAVATVYYLRGSAGAIVRQRLISRLAGIIFTVVILNILTSGSVGQIAGVFARKYGEKTDITATRAGKVDNAQRTFEKHAVFGKGFGLAMDGEEFFVEKDPVFGLPLSAPVEAGVIYSAAPAQLGILGTVFLLIFMYVYLTPLFTRGAAPVVGLAAVCFFVNFGEYVFFSTGGVGMYHWLMYGLAYHIAVRYPETQKVSQTSAVKEARVCPRTT